MAAGRSGRSAVMAMRRRRKFRRFWNEYGHYIMAGTALAVIVIIVAVLAAAFSSMGAGQQGKPQEIHIEAKPVEAAARETGPAETEADLQYPFNQMSLDWDGEDLAGFLPYTIPQEYTDAGGDFPEAMQMFTYIIAKQNGVDYTVVAAMIEVESGYKWDAIGAGGDVGYMQIVEKWHGDRMERLNAGNMQNPFHNVQVGIDFLAELLEKYGGDYGKALTAYKYGSTGAYKHFFSAGVYSCKYAERVLEVADRINAEMTAIE